MNGPSRPKDLASAWRGRKGGIKKEKRTTIEKTIMGGKEKMGGGWESRSLPA